MATKYKKIPTVVLGRVTRERLNVSHHVVLQLQTLASRDGLIV